MVGFMIRPEPCVFWSGIIVQDLESLGFQMPQRTKRQVDKEQQASGRGTGGTHSAPEERLTHRRLRVIYMWGWRPSGY